MIDTDDQRLAGWVTAGLAGQAIARDDARAILADPSLDLLALLHAAGRVRRQFFDNTVSVHVLDNVRNGACPEDCGYCGQSKISDAPLKPYKIKPIDEIVAEAERAKQSGAFRYCMALSGRGPNDRDIEHMSEAIRRIKAMGLRTCLSSGLMDADKARKLKDAGLDRLNHNLNTSASHYPSICSTHTYQDRMDTLRAARHAGLDLCSGMIVGMGEGHEDLLDVAYTLKEFGAESIPVNFLLPIEGNPVQRVECEGEPLSPRFVLRVLAMVRLVNPTAEVRIAAGRELHLRTLQPLALWPANSLFMDGYLLTKGQGADQTLRMIIDAGFRVRLDEGDWPEHLRRLAAGESGPDTEELAAGPDGASEAIYGQLKPTVTRSDFVPSSAVGTDR